MSLATNSSVLVSSPRFAWIDALRDLRDGTLATVRLVVTSAGWGALFLAAVVVINDDLRNALRSLMPVSTATAEERSEHVATVEEPPAAAPTAAVTADPRQKHVVSYLARRYRVAEEAARMLVVAAYQIGQEQKLDPLLILSVVAVESSLNPFAESAMGAQGLMQIMTKIHADRFEAHGGQIAALDPVANMKVGSAILSDLITRGGSVERGLQLYVGAGNLPDDGGYGTRVLGERARLALAASGKVDAAIAAARTAVASEQPKPGVSDAGRAPAERVGLPAAETDASVVADRKRSA
jgi:hypothetical protein